MPSNKVKNPEQMTHKKFVHGANPLVQIPRGWVAGTAGLPGDIEGLARLFAKYAGAPNSIAEKWGQQETPTLPTSEFYKEWLPLRDEGIGSAELNTLGSLTGGMGSTTLAGLAAKYGTKATKAAVANAAVPSSLSKQAGVIKMPVGVEDNNAATVLHKDYPEKGTKWGYSGNVYYEPNDVRQKKLSDLFGAFGSKSDSNSFMSPTNARLLHEKGLLKASKKELNLLLDMTDSNGVIRPQIEGGFIYPQDKALKAAQRNASLPVSKGGLGLHTDNTATERAEAMGFTGDTFHGTPDDRIVRSRQFKDEMLGKSTRVSDAKKGHFTVDDGTAASEYIWHDGSTDGGNVLPLKLAGDRGSVRLPGEWQPGRFDSAIDQAKDDGLDGLTIQGTTTLGKPGDYQVTFDPKNLRSRFAAFDPMRRNEADILAGLIPFGLIDSKEKQMEYAKGGSVTRLTTGSGINTAHYADGGSVYDPARVDALVAQLKEELYAD